MAVNELCMLSFHSNNFLFSLQVGDYVQAEEEARKNRVSSW